MSQVFSIKEKDIIKSCMQYLLLKGYEVIRNNSGAFVVAENGKKRLIRFGSPGSPDLIACSPDGRFVAIECKSKRGKLTDFQRNYLNRIAARGGIALVVRSVEELERAGL